MAGVGTPLASTRQRALKDLREPLRSESTSSKLCCVFANGGCGTGAAAARVRVRGIAAVVVKWDVEQASFCASEGASANGPAGIAADFFNLERAVAQGLLL